jgi:hypothetical protein
MLHRAGGMLCFQVLKYVRTASFGNARTSYVPFYRIFSNLIRTLFTVSED